MPLKISPIIKYVNPRVYLPLAKRKKMKKNNQSIVDTLILSLMVVLLIIGAHQTYVIGQVEGFRNGFFKSYYIFMLMLILFVVYQMRKNKREKASNMSAKEPDKSQYETKAAKKAKNKAK